MGTKHFTKYFRRRQSRPRTLAIPRYTYAIALFLALTFAFVSGQSNRAQGAGLIVQDITGNNTPAGIQGLVQNTLLGGGGVTVSNTSYTGPDVALGTFSGGANIIGFDSGIILSTGSVQGAVGPNFSQGITGFNGTPGDADLNAILGFPGFEVTADASVLEFDFVPTNNVIFFEYVFSSDEYNEFVGFGFTDLFAFLLHEAGNPASKVNVAVLPGTTTPVTIDNVNNGNPLIAYPPTNSEFYKDNDCQLPACQAPYDTEMDGLTVVLPVIAQVQAGTTYHIKLAIADTNDGVVDSNVFIRAGSFVDTNPPIAVDDQATTLSGIAVDVDVLVNDSDPDGDQISVGGVTQGDSGAVSINANGTVKYTPNAGFIGIDSFTYEVVDIFGAASYGTVTVTVDEGTGGTGGTNGIPQAADDAYTVSEGATIDTNLDLLPTVLANDTDPDSDPLSAVLAFGPSNGTVTLNADGSFVYTHNGGETTSDSFTYKANDGTDDSNIATVNITVNPVNDAPVAVDDSYSLNEGATIDTAMALLPGILDNDIDAEGGPLNALIVTGTANGTLTLNANGSFIYTHDGGETTSDSFTYKANDGASDSNVATVNITVNPVNDAPVAFDDSYSLDEGGILDTVLLGLPGILGNDSDAENNALTATPVSGPFNGAMALAMDGSFIYVHDGSETTIDSITYTANDGTADSNVAKVTFTINPVNDPPTPFDDSVSTSEDTPIPSIDVLVNDTDAEGDVLTVTSVTQAASGVVAINVDGTISYSPELNFNGPDMFAYTVADGNGGEADASVSITVGGVNDPPAAFDDSVVTNEDNQATISALANDSDPEADLLSISSITQPLNGQAALNIDDNSITYTPNADFNGTDTFGYTVSDPLNATDQGTVNITVNPVNDVPVALDDAVATNEDTSITTGVLSNDSDIDGNTLTVESITQPTNGTAVLNLDNTVTFNPDPEFNGTASFTYTINDGNNETATATVTVTVNSVNDLPVAADDSAATQEDTPVTLDVLSNDSDIDGDVLHVSQITVGATNGTVGINIDGTITYSPYINFSGSDSFVYTVSDGNGGTDTASVSIVVSGVNDPPIAVDDNLTVAEDSAGNVIDVLANDSDPDGSLDVSSVSIPLNGSVSINLDSTLSYTPNPDFDGLDSFTYTVCDNDGVCSIASVFVTVEGINDAPTIVDDSVFTNENTSISIPVLDNDSDIDGTLDPTTITLATLPLYGDAVVDASIGQIVYTPDFYYIGSDSFAYNVCDNDGSCGTATVTISIQLGVNPESVIKVDFREITYFNRNKVITSSDPQIRLNNNIEGEFDTTLWPYDPTGGKNKTKSRPTMFRIYGFASDHVGSAVQDANDPLKTYTVVADAEIPGAYYVDLGGPAEVYVPVSYLQNDLIKTRAEIKAWTLPGTQKLTDAQRNVPGIMLNHNLGVIKLPRAIRQQMENPRKFGLLDFIGFQVWGHGNPKFREFVDIEIQFVYDALDHEKFGFRTANSGNFEGFSSCNYVDFAAGGDTARFNDVWKGVQVGNPHYGPACGNLEGINNQKVRANYSVPFDSIQLLPTVNVHNDTTRIFFGEIRTRGDSSDD